MEAIYETPQEPDSEAAEGFQILYDSDEERVNQIAGVLGWTRVGWIFGHDVREEGHVMTAAEIIMAAELQLEAADGIHETPFVTVFAVLFVILRRTVSMLVVVAAEIELLAAGLAPLTGFVVSVETIVLFA